MSFVPRNRALLSCLPLAALAIGCGNTAAVTTRYGHLEGKILPSSNQSEIHLEIAGREQVVPRSDIADVDHPGNVAGTIGTVVTAYGIANIVVGVPQCDRGGPAYCIGVFLPAAIGLPVAIWGFTTWAGSKANAEGKGDQKDMGRLSIVPIASVDKKNQIFGASASFSY